MKFKKNLLIGISVFLIIAFIYLAYNSSPYIHYKYSNFGTNIPDGNYDVGIDVSHYQEAIDWHDLDSMVFGTDSIRFAMIKATEGLKSEDTRYLQNSDAIRNTDLSFSFYHFFHPAESAKNQALHFIGAIEAIPFDLKPVIDIEIMEDRTSQEIIDSVLVFINEVEKQLKTRPLIYTYTNFYDENFRNSTLNTELFWIANYTADYAFNEQENAVIWQFSDKGTVNGIKTAVDLNLVKRNRWEDLKR